MAQEAPGSREDETALLCFSLDRDHTVDVAAVSVRDQKLLHAALIVTI